MSYRLIQAGNRWQFETEQSLETFMWLHLEKLGVQGLAQQYRVENQVCDLLAVTLNRQLVILELKNAEDRYVVQQLTRYYDAIARNQPFADQVDYAQPIQLMAIAPTFHSDNFIDQQYCKLDIDFLKVSIREAEAQYCSVILKNLATQECQQIQIQRPADEPTALPKPISTFDSILRKCPEMEQAGIRWLREKLLSYHSAMKEVRDGSAVIYQRNKARPCAELHFDSARQRAALFLYLPYVHGGNNWSYNNRAIGTFRVRIWTDWLNVLSLGHVNKGLGRKVSLEELEMGAAQPLVKLKKEIAQVSGYYGQTELFEKKWLDLEWRSRLLEKIVVKGQDSPFGNPHYKAGGAMRFAYYAKSIGQPELDSSLEAIVDLALETWLKRL